ncbi:hypothetical protein J3A83DRAFT_4368159 [Scleroderma citrinum]
MVFKGRGKSGFISIKASLDDKLVSLNDDTTESQYRLSILKNECKAMKLQVYMHQKEMAHMEAEVKSAHCHTVEQRQLEINLVKEQQELLCLKYVLAKLEAGKDSVGGMELSTAEPSSQD